MVPVDPGRVFPEEFVVKFRRGARPRFLVALGAAVAVLMAPVFVAPASAHSQLIGGDPKDGSAVDKAPAAITLTFNEDLQNLPGSKSNQIVVKDRNGQEVTTGSVKVTGTKLSRPLGKLPAGTYDVAWSALSADGHRVSGDGNYAFTVTKGEKAAAAPTSTSSAAAGSERAQANSAPADAASDSSSEAAPAKAGPAPTVTVMWVVGGFLVLAIILGIILQVTRKKAPKEH